MPSNPATSSAADRTVDRFTRSDLLVASLALVAAVALRTWVLSSPIGALDSDEAVVGLMARHIISHHHVPVFFWGQAYGGSLEAIVGAGLFAVFGSSVAALKVVPLALSTLCYVLVYYLGSQLMPRRVALLAAAAFAISTPNFIWWSTKERGFYWMCLALGLGVLTLALRITRNPTDLWAWGWFGLVCGLAFWTSPQSIYFVLPALGWLALVLRPVVVQAMVAPLTFLVGATPWIYGNVRNGGASLRPGTPFHSTYLSRLGLLFSHGIPVALGMHAGEHWLLPVFPALYVTAAILACLQLARRRPHSLLLVSLLMFPFLFAVFPQSRVIGEGRYVLYLAPFLWLALAWALTNRVALVVGLVAVLALSLCGMHVTEELARPYVAGATIPGDDTALLRALRQDGIHVFVGNYWIAYRTAFETREKIIGSPDLNSRWPPYDVQVRGGRRPPSHVFVVGEVSEQAYHIEVSAHPECYRRTVLGGFVLYSLNPAFSDDLATSRCAF